MVSNMQLQNFKTFCASILLSKDKCYIVFECKQCFDFYNQMLFCTRSAMILMLLTNKTFYEYCHFCEQMIKIECLFKVEKILKGSLDSPPSPLPSVKIQIMGGKVCFLISFHRLIKAEKY